MDIILNNHQESVAENSTLYDVVAAHLKDNHKGIAVAVNNHVVGKQQWKSTSLQPNDNILIIKATQGG